jgi:hypothetical protein
VCEDYLLQEIGSSCPKHDLPLEAQAPPRPRFEDANQAVTWTTVARYTDSLTAEAPRIRLEAEGIPTFVEGQRMGSKTMYHVATGGVKLKVPDSLASDARVILSQTWSATAAGLDLEEEWDDDLDEPSLNTETDDDGEIETDTDTERSSLSQILLIFLFVGLPALLMVYLLLEFSSAQ